MIKFRPASWMLSLCTLGLVACNTPTTPFPHAELRPGSVITMNGTVQRVINNSQALPETLVLALNDGGTTPLAIPPELGIVVTGKLNVGLRVVATVVVTDIQPEPLYRLIFLRDGRNAVYVPAGPNDPRFVHAEGTVKAINTNAAGETESVLLSSGVTVRLAARDATQQQVAVGSALSADGPVIQLASGGLAIDARQLNGLAMRVSLPPGGWNRAVVDEGDMGDAGMMDGGGDYGGE